MNTSQLRLLAATPDWKLDQETKDVGRKGLEMARQALRAHTLTDDNVQAQFPLAA